MPEQTQEAAQDIFEIWNVTRQELSQAILENGSLRGMVFGYVAEIKIRNFLRDSGLISELVKDDDHDRKKKGDLRLQYRGQEFRLESKSLQTARNVKAADGFWKGFSQVDASDRRTVLLPDGTSLATTCLVFGEFDVLSVNCFTFENQWRFAFAKNKDLPASTFGKYTPEQRKHLVATTVAVSWPPTGIFTDDLFGLLDEIIKDRTKSKEVGETVTIQEKGHPLVKVEE